MRASIAICLLGLACVSGNILQFANNDAGELLSQIDSAFQEMGLTEEQAVAESYPAEPEAVYVVDQGTGGAYRVSGMLQTFVADDISMNPVSQLLERPRLPFFDLSWSNWVDERLQVLDLLQEMVGPQPAPTHKCPHMQPEGASLDPSMVSYLASSRFGPAILTTYAQQFQDRDESDMDFDYESVFLAEQEGESLGKSYQDASLLEDLSADASAAFQSAEGDSRILFQGDNVGFFGARLIDNGLGRVQLDGEFESVQPSLRSPVTYFADWDGDLEDLEEASPLESARRLAGPGQVPKSPPPATSTEQACNYFLFGLLSVGCIWVWYSLARSCCATFAEAKQRKRESREAGHRQAQKELLAPLMPEGAEKNGVEIAAFHSPQGNFVSPQGSQFITVAVPLVQDPSK